MKATATASSPQSDMPLSDAPLAVRFFHRPDDPWSHLLTQLLPRLEQTYRVRLDCITVPFPDTVHAPRPDLLIRHALRDARDLAAYHQVEFRSDGQPPPPALTRLATRALLRPATSAAWLSLAEALGSALFAGDRDRVERLCDGGGLPDEAETDCRLDANRQQLLDAGHYLSGMIECRGVWYWGIDRLSHLEHDLTAAGLRRPEGSVGLLQRRPAADWPTTAPVTAPATAAAAALAAAPAAMPAAGASAGSPDTTLTLDWFCSFRSPYAWVGAERTLALARRYPVRIRPRLIIPMKMAGFTIPERKRDYFRLDPAREALRHGVRFGNFCDPFGAGLERAMALVAAAEQAGRLEPYLLSVMAGVWADGVDTATDEGLRWLTERAGIDWSVARRSLGDDSWRTWADRNRSELAELGQYAAPTFRLGDWVTWGQDRIWIVEEKIRAALGLGPGQL